VSAINTTTKTDLKNFKKKRESIIKKRGEKEGNKMTVDSTHAKFKILHHNVQGFTNKQS
jgi:hypothetical protein